ncbi:MAG: hypothetical protein EZS28_009601, partial [Streblomastix strix]
AGLDDYDDAVGNEVDGSVEKELSGDICPSPQDARVAEQTDPDYVYDETLGDQLEYDSELQDYSSPVLPDYVQDVAKDLVYVQGDIKGELILGGGSCADSELDVDDLNVEELPDCDYDYDPVVDGNDKLANVLAACDEGKVKMMMKKMMMKKKKMKKKMMMIQNDMMKMIELSIKDGDLFVYESEDCSDVVDSEEYQELAKSSVLEESIDILYLYFYQLVSFSDSANQFQYGIDQGGCDCVQAIFAFIYFFIPDLSSKDSTEDDVGVA